MFFTEGAGNTHPVLVDDVALRAMRNVGGLAGGVRFRVAFELDPGADLDAVIQRYRTVEVNFGVGLLVEADPLAVDSIKRVVVFADTEDLFGEAAERQGRLLRERRTGNGEDTGSDQSGRRQ